MFAELLAHPGVIERAELRSRFGFMAIHGGSLERGTAEVAAAAAAAAGASLYTVEQPDNLRWHLPSHRADPDAAPNLAAFLGHVEVVVSVHGYGRSGWWTRMLVGGEDRVLARVLGEHLRAALPGYEVVTDIAEIPAELRGLHPSNPVNLARAGGAQLELPPRVRGIGPRATREQTDALIAGLASFAA